MRRKIILISIIFSLFLSPAISSAQTTTRQRIDHYEVIRENVAWYQKIAMMFLGLNWDKVSIKTTFSKNKNESEKIVSVIAWPDNAETENPEESEIVFQLDGNIKEVESFLDFLKRTKFKEEEVPKLLSLYNYLYDGNLKEMDFSTTNLLQKENGSMYCKFSKKKTGGQNLISIQTFNSSGAENGSAEVIMNLSPERFPEEISAQLKIGPKIILRSIKLENPPR